MSISFNDNIKLLSPKPLDSKYLNGSNQPYTDITEVNNTILISERHIGLTVNINGVEYWYKDGIEFNNLVLKTADTTGNVDISQLNNYQLLSEKGQINGYPSLDGNGKIIEANLPDSILGQLTYGGTFNATTTEANLSLAAKSKLGTASNSIFLTDDNTITTGYGSNEAIYYIVNVAGTFANNNYTSGDWLLCDGLEWGRLDTSNDVVSVFGRTGVVVAANGDYNTDQITEQANTNKLFVTQEEKAEIAANTLKVSYPGDQNLAPYALLGGSNFTGSVTSDLEFNNGNSGTGITINWNNKNFQKIVLTGNASLSFSSPVGAAALTLKIQQDVNGGRNIKFPFNVDWGETGEPTWTNMLPNEIAILSFYWDGSIYYGFSKRGFNL